MDAEGRFERLKDVDWKVWRSAYNTVSKEHVALAVLLDLRDELRSLNALLHCSNFIEMPRILRQIRSNTVKPKKKKKVAVKSKRGDAKT